eukprot:scaffold15.g4354.t1
MGNAVSTAQCKEESTAMRIKEALTGESTEEVGSDARNDSDAPEDTSPAAPLDAAAGDSEPGNAPLRATGGGGGGEEGAGHTEGMVPVSQSTPSLEERQEDSLKDVTLRTAPIDVRFPSSNQASHSRRCYVAFNEYNKCVADKGPESAECRVYARAFRSICPDEWIANWRELKDEGTWYGKY